MLVLAEYLAKDLTHRPRSASDDVSPAWCGPISAAQQTFCLNKQVQRATLDYGAEARCISVRLSTALTPSSGSLIALAIQCRLTTDNERWRREVIN